MIKAAEIQARLQSYSESRVREIYDKYSEFAEQVVGAQVMKHMGNILIDGPEVAMKSLIIYAFMMHEAVAEAESTELEDLKDLEF